MKKSKSPFRPMSRAVALEPRLLFDGAGAVAVVDALVTDYTAPAAQQAPVAEASAARPAEGDAGVLALMDSTDGLSVTPDAQGGVLLVVDARVADYQGLLAELPANVQVRVIADDESGLAVVSEELARGGRFDAIHIISHGTPGNLTLGSDQFSSDTLASQGAALQGWAEYLGEDADILLYGCDVAQGEQGQAFIDQLAELTGADIAASTDPTGAAGQGGDWHLEATTGRIEAGVLSAAAYDGLLAAPTVTDDMSPDEPASIRENTSGPVGTDIKISGTGSDSLSVTASVGKGSLSATTFTGTAAAVESWLAGLQYTYTGNAQTGDSDTLTLVITNESNGGQTIFTRDLTIAPENDVPVLTPPAKGGGRLSVIEGGSGAFSAATGNGTTGSPVSQINLGLVDVDNTQAQVIIKLTGLPSQGVLLLNGNELAVGSTFAVSDIANLVYKHNGSQVLSDTTDTFAITVDDGAGGLLTNQTVTVDITPKNDDPSAGGSIVLIEGETGVGLVGGSVPVIGGPRGDLIITDPDDSTHTVQVTGLPSHGTLRYNGTAVTLGQTINNANLALFTYDHDGSETTSDGFKIVVTDGGGGTGTPAPSAEQTISLSIIPNNDDPYWDSSTQPNGAGAFPPVVFGPDSGTSNTSAVLTITNGMLQVRDAESPPERLTYTLTEVPSGGGYLRHVDHPGQYLPAGFTFTQADIDAGKIEYVSYSGNSHDAAFKFTVMDGDRRLFPSPRDGGIYPDGGASTPLTVHTFQIRYEGTATGPGPGPELTPAQIPTVSGSLSLGISDIAEGQFYTLGTGQLSAISTGVPPEQLTYRLLSLPTNGTIFVGSQALSLLGSFTQKDIEDGRVRFQHDGSEDFESSFTFDVSNGNTITELQTFNIAVKPQNDTPVASGGDPVRLIEGNSLVINSEGKSHIVLTDGDNDSSDRSDGYALDNTLSFRVDQLPQHGSLELYNGTTWNAVAQGQVIAKADLDAGRLRYVHGGGEHYSDSFTIVPLDDKGVATTTNNTNANANPPAGDPTNQRSEGSPVVIAIGINPLNDAPGFVSKGEPGFGGIPALKEGSGFTIGGATGYTGSNGSGDATAPGAGVPHLVYQDSDNTNEQRQYRITEAPKYGTITVGGRVLGVGSVFTQAELDAGLVKYQHGGGEQLDDLFKYVVSDGDYTANESEAVAQGDTITPSEYRILIERSNDKPTVTTGHTGLFVVDSSNTGKTLPGITLGDIDLADGVQTGETDFVQVTVEFLNAANNPYTNGQLHFTATTGVTLIGTSGGQTLVFQGKLADVQSALNQVTAKTDGTDANLSNLKIKVTLDDRLRDGSGNLSGGANGGTLNQDGTAPNATFNTASITLNVAASDRNDLPVLTAPNAFTVNEDVRTLITGVSYADADAFDSTTNTVTFSVDTGRLYFHGSNSSVTGGATVSAGAIGSSSVTLTGTKAQLDAALSNLRYQGANNYNGDATLSITVSDGNNYGQDGTSGNAADASKVIAIAILPVNDAPTITGSIAQGANRILTSPTYTFAAGELGFNDAADISNAVASGFQAGVDNYQVTLSVTGVATISLATTTGLTVTGAGTGTVTLTGSRADLQAAIASAGNVTLSAGNIDGPITFSMQVNDLGNGGTLLIDPTTGTSGITGNLSASRTFTFLPTSQNDAPTVTNLTDRGYTENTTITLDGDVNLADPELDQFTSWNGATLTITRDGGADPQDVFGLTGSGSTGVNFNGGNIRIGTTVVGTYTHGGGTLQITFNANATPANVDTVARAVTYTNSSDKPPASITLRYTVSDQNRHAGDDPADQGSGQDQGAGGVLTGSATLTLTVTKLADLPELSSAPAQNAQFTENQSTPVVVDNTLTVTDVDDDDIHSATVFISGNFLAGDVLAVNTAGTNIVASYNASTGLLTLTGVDSKANYQQVLRGLTYSTPSDDPTVNTTRPTRTLTYTLYDNGSDGADVAGGGHTTTTRTVDVIPVNDAPLLAGAGSTRGYTENGPALVLEPTGWTLTDLDDTQMVRITAQITSGLHADDVLAIPAGSLPTGWTQHYDAASGTLTLSGSATNIANVTAALAAVTYRNTGEDPGDSDRVVTWQVRDANSDAASNGQLLSNTVTTTIEVTPVNDPPVATDDNNTISESATAPVTGNVITGTSSNGTNSTSDSDPDTPVADLKVTNIVGEEGSKAVAEAASTIIEGRHGTLTIEADGSYSYVQHPGLEVADGDTLTDEFTYTLSDGDASDTAKLVITIEGVDNGVTVDVPNDTTATTPNGNVSDHVVFESGLSTGSGPNADDIKVDSSFTIVARDGLATTAAVVIGYTDENGNPAKTLSRAEIEALGTANQTITTQYGTLVLNGYSQAADGTITVSYEYTLTTAPEMSGVDTYDSFTIDAADHDGDVSTSHTLNIKIVDDAPVAENDAATVDNATNQATGNALIGPGADTKGADDATITAIGSNGVPGNSATDNGTTLTIEGEHGTLVIDKTTGAFTFTRNDGEPLTATDTFTYTLTDGDGDADTATITISIDDKEPVVTDGSGTPPSSEPVDPADPSGPSRLVVKPDGSVSEAGLPNGSNPGSGRTTTGTITFTPGDGNNSVTLEGTPITGTGQTISTPQGEVTITEFDPVTGKIGYEYELKTPTSGDNTTDEFDVVITDADGDDTAVTVVIDIVDDVPVAENDAATVDNATNQATGNALIGPGADTKGADDATITAIGSNGVPGNSATDNGTTLTIEGEHGTLVIDKTTGAFTFTRNDGEPLTATDTFTYTLTDGDGDADTATITISIDDKEPVVTDGSGTPPSIEPDPNNPGDNRLVVKPDGSVSEAGLPNGSNPGSGRTTTGTITFTPGDGNNSVTLEGTPITGTGQTISTPQGEVTITEFDPVTGKIGYEYELKTPTSGDNTTDEFDVVITDTDGDDTAVTVVIDIVDDVPVAENDAFGTREDVPVSGNLTGNDTPSADGSNVWALETPPANGRVTINPDGTFTYTPNRGFSGSDSFTYTITDADGSTSSATVTIEVVANDPPQLPPSNPIAPPEPGAPSTSTPSSPDSPAPWKRPQVHEPSVFYYGEMRYPITNLPLPMHPALFVNNEVNNAQLERELGDRRASGNPDLASAPRWQVRSLAMGLGFVPDQFVMDEVHNTQSLSQRLASLIESRYSRLSLAGDGLLATPELSQPDPAMLVPPLGDAPQQADDAQAEQAFVPRPAPSFTEQLRGGGMRVPLATRESF